MTYDPTKPTLWDGKPASVLAHDLDGDYPIAVYCHDGLIRCFPTGGRLPHHTLLTNAPQIHPLTKEGTVFFNLGDSFSSSKGARNQFSGSRYPILAVTFFNGEIAGLKIYQPGEAP